MDKTNQQVESRLRIVNSHKQGTRFVLEPWGEIYEIPAGSIIEARIFGSRIGTPEIQFDTDQITFYCDFGSTISLVLDGIELGGGDGNRTTVPDYI